MMTQCASTVGFRGERFAFESPEAALMALVTAAPRISAHECVPLADAGSRVLAEPVSLDRDSPPFDHSAMDGYAIGPSLNADTLQIPVHGDSRIGHAPPSLTSAGSAIRISTGSPIPSGCDRVIPREDVVEVLDAGGEVAAVRPRDGVLARSRAGAHVRARGENARAGARVASVGCALTPATIAAIAATGRADISVFARLRVACLTTGDELAAAGCSAADSTIHNSNLPALTALLQRDGCIALVERASVVDDAAAVEAALTRALDLADAIVTTGGVSMGHRDPVRDAIARLGGRVMFHGLPQRPGKPLLVAEVPRPGRAAAMFFGLPGNPVSALVTATRIALPCMRAMAGVIQPATLAPSTRVALADDDAKRLDLWWHRLVSIDVDGRARLVPQRGSGDLIALGRSDGFVEIPPQASGSELFRFFPWS